MRIEKELSESELLNTCPWCRYSLFGLPIKHVCPECGQPFDRQWKVFGGKPPWQTFGQARRVFAIIFLIIVTVLIFYPLKDAILVGGLSIYFLSGLYIYMLIRSLLSDFSRPPMFVAVGPAGLAVGNLKKHTLEQFSWDRLGEADTSNVLVKIDGVNKSFNAWGQWGQGSSEAKRCAEYINDYLDERRYA